MPEYVVLDRLCKRFGSLVAVDGISFTVNKGEVLGFIGPNGSGKSTTMKMATGFLEPDSGSATICGVSMSSDQKAAKRHIGYLPEGAPAYGEMTTAGFLDFIAEIRGFGGAERRRRIDKAAERAELGSVMGQRIETLSKGFKRRVGLAQAILHTPEVLILDEPTDGLDPNQKHHVRTLIAEMSGEAAIVISTHILEEVEAVCSRVVLIDRGRVILDGTAGDLQTRMPYHNAVVLKVPGAAAPQARRALEAVASIARIEETVGADGTVSLRAYPRDGRIITADVAEMISASDIRVEELIVEQGRLDDAFRELTTSETDSRHA